MGMALEMVQTDSAENYEHAASLVRTTVAPEALIVVGILGVTMAVLVVSCHLYRTFARHEGQAVFEADDKLILTYFYAVIVLFGAIAAF